MARSAKQRLCHMSPNKRVCTICGLRGRSAVAQGSKDGGLETPCDTRVQHQSSPSFTQFGIVAKRLGFREMVKTHCPIWCCGQLLEFARTSARVCVPRSCASDAHHFFAECFIGYRRSMRTRRVTATRELQHDTSLRKFFVLGALVPVVLLATRWVRPPSMTGGVGNPTTVEKELSHQSRSVTYSCSRLSCYRASNIL